VLTLNEYDENFRKQTSTVASGTVAAAKTSFDYDEVGNPTTITDPLTHVTKTIYDSRNRKQNVIAAYGDAFSQTTTFHYDDKINLTSINRADGTTETKTYDKLNRMVTDTVPQTSTISLTTAFVYNLSGTIQKVTDPKLQATTFLYNEADLKTRMTYPNGSYQAWGYDGMYNLTSRRSVRGATQSFPQYDIRNRQTRMQWDNDPDYANFDYDDAGRLTIANNANSAVTRIYDRAGRLTDDIQNVTGSSNFDVHYTYDTGGNTGRLTEINIGAGYDAQYDYDEMGRLQLIFDNFRPALAKYSYDKASNLTRRDTYPNTANAGAIAYGTVDALNRWPNRSVIFGGNTISKESYGYDKMNRLTTIDRTEDNKRDQFGYYLDGELNIAQYGLAIPTPDYQKGQIWIARFSNRGYPKGHAGIGPDLHFIHWMILN
jgi:YD repeat-containing protein